MPYEIMVHCGCKERKSCAHNGPKERVDGDRTIRVKAVAVDYVVDALLKCDETAYAEECTGEHLRNPRDVWIGSPLQTVSGFRKTQWDIRTYYPNQNRPMGRTMAPIIMGGRRSSGMGLPCFSRAFLKLVAVK